MINGVEQEKYGTICVVPADNLASNLMGGFKEGSRANRGCRHCLATELEMKTIFKEPSFKLRTMQDHLANCDALEASGTQREYQQLSTEFGVNHRSLLNDLSYFNVCSGGLIQDVMHDVLEGTEVQLLSCNFYVLFSVGVLEYETKELLLIHIDQEKLYSLDHIKQKIDGLDLGYVETKDRPSTITTTTLHSKDHKLKQGGKC